MTLSRFRKLVLLSMMGTMLVSSAGATAGESEGQQVIDALRAADHDGGVRSGIGALTPGQGICLDNTAADLAKLGTVPLLLNHRKYLAIRDDAPRSSEPSDLELIAAGEGQPLAIDRSQFHLPSSGGNCRMTYYISTPLQLGERVYVEIGYGQCGSLCGGGKLVTLRKENGRWEVEKLIGGWAS